MPVLINILVVGWLATVCTVCTGYWSCCACPDKYSSGWLAGYCVLSVLDTGAAVPVLINILVVGWLATVYCVYWVLELLCLS